MSATRPADTPVLGQMGELYSVRHLFLTRPGWTWVSLLQTEPSNTGGTRLCLLQTEPSNTGGTWLRLLQTVPSSSCWTWVKFLTDWTLKHWRTWLRLLQTEPSNSGWTWLCLIRLYLQTLRGPGYVCYWLHLQTLQTVLKYWLDLVMFVTDCTFKHCRLYLQTLVGLGYVCYRPYLQTVVGPGDVCYRLYR